MDCRGLEWLIVYRCESIVDVGRLDWAEVGLWWILVGQSGCQCVEADHNGLGQVLVWWLACSHSAWGHVLGIRLVLVRCY